jgi:hypothetical protein
MAIAIVEKRLEEEAIGREFLVSRLTQAYKPRLHDQLCKEIYLEFAKMHPQYMAELMLWYKPKSLWKFTSDDWKWTKPGLQRPDSLCFLAAFALCLLAYARSGTAVGWGVPVVISFIGLLGSMLPLFWAYPFFHVLSEFFILAGMTIVFGGAAVIGVALRLTTRVSALMPLARLRLGRQKSRAEPSRAE